MSDDVLVRHAKRLLLDDAAALADARAYWHTGNTVPGAFLSMRYGAPRWASEAAVALALALIEGEDEEGEEEDEEDEEGEG